MGRRKSHQRPHIFWRNGRASGDFRSYEDVGGGREVLAGLDSSWATTDEEIASALF